MSLGGSGVSIGGFRILREHKIFSLEVEVDYLLNGFSEKKNNIMLVGIYNQQFQGTIILMVFDLQGSTLSMILVG